ncbi:hypothetical protein NX059_007852 [Plenodomus lindquistii]|nr:hypothetical protein NX059_007852 [Plenodomus lindquistii]
MMREVYHKANEVFAWLGLGDVKTDQAMEFIKSFEHLRGTLAGLHPLMHVDDAVNDLVKEMDNQQLRRGLTSIFERAYWSRLWILQELAASKSTTFACGDKTVSFDKVMNIATAVGTYLNTWGSRPNLLHERACTTITNRQYVWLITLIDKHRGMDLAELIFLSQETTCKNPIDYIRALLGLVTAGEGRNIRGRDCHTACTIMNRAIEAMLKDLKNWPYTERMDRARVAECKGLALRTHHSFYEVRGHDVLVQKNLVESQKCEEWQDLLQTCRRIANTMYQHNTILLTRSIKGRREKWNYMRTYMERVQINGL